jgi:glycosyltransferase involved in cell wall biosynthesis
VKKRLLVVTTVHHPDDNRIREKTIRSLEPDFQITYAARSPGPSNVSGLVWQPLPGGRLRRNIRAWRVAWSGGFDSVSLHDPELLLLGLVLSSAGRTAVVFDVHEDIPAQIMTKEWVPKVVRKPLAATARMLLRLAERSMTLTLAESSYSSIFDREHPVISNFPDTSDLPKTSGGDGAVYVGDVTVARGLVDAVVACGIAGVPLTVVGPYRPEVRAAMEAAASRLGTHLVMTERLPHDRAMEVVASAAVAISPLRDIPNYRHSIPTKVLEYLAVGVPVAASDLPATRALVDGLDAVELHEPGNPDDLARAIRLLLPPDVGVAARAQADDVRRRFRWPSGELRRVYRASR